MEIRDVSDLAKLVDDLPELPGVYLWKDEEGKIIYIGKAKALRKRVSSYLSRKELDAKTSDLMSHARDIETIVTNTELEAVILESTLIKQHMPKYNIALKDDRRHAWIRVDLNKDYPVFEVTRDVTKDGANYYGPYGSTRRLDRFLDSARKFIPIAMCRSPEEVKRECTDYYLGRCAGPCKEHVPKEEYRSMVEQMRLYLEGKEAQLTQTIKKEMDKAASNLEFERAARLRDRLKDIEIVMRKQKVFDIAEIDRDVLGISRTEQAALVEMLIIRTGRLVGTDHFYFELNMDTTDSEVLSSFVEQFYFRLPQVPDEILLPLEIPEMEQLSSWLSQNRTTPVKLFMPTEGKASELVKMANANATRSLRRILVLGDREEEIVDEGVKQLKEALGLTRAPLHIEGFDIANIQGTDPTGSCVVFVNGQPVNANYRMFRVRVKETPDDYAMMHEVVLRRYRGVLEEGGIIPDLIMVDGGKGQLSAALKALGELGLEYLPIAALAKKEEIIFTQDNMDGIALPQESGGLRLIQRIRDEAHRFAQRYHHILREKRFSGSILEEAPGIGPKRRAALLNAFGSYENVRSASIEELAKVDGMSQKTAEALKEWLDREGTK
jgi:excinuclease ABC subunit C